MNEAVKIRLTDRKRESILDAAVMQFRSSGYDNTSMDRISEAANVSKRTVYNHFPSKEDLFAAIVDRLKSRLESVTEYLYAPDRPLEPQLRQIAQAYLDLTESEELRNLARVILPRFLQTSEIAQQLLGDIRPGEQSFIRWIKAAQKAGKLIPADATRASRQFHGLFDSFAFWPQIIGGEPALTKKQKTDLINSTVDLFLSHYSKDC